MYLYVSLQPHSHLYQIPILLLNYHSLRRRSQNQKTYVWVPIFFAVSTHSHGLFSWCWKKKKKKSPYSYFINGSPYLVKLQQQQEQHYPFLPMCAVVVCVQTMECLPVFGIFNVRKEVGALSCIPGLCKHQNWLEEKRPSSHPGNELCLLRRSKNVLRHLA